MAQARAIFKCEGEPAISLCCDNARRKQINEETNRRLAPQSAQLFESNDGTMLLHPGLPLVGSRIAHGILNAVWYEVTAVDGETLHLIDDKNTPVNISLEKAKSCLQLRFALTVHKSQSKRLKGMCACVRAENPATCHATGQFVICWWVLRALLQ